MINISILNQNIDNYQQQAFSRALRNKNRKRRKNLSLEEVLRKRKLTKARSRMKWMKKKNDLFLFLLWDYTVLLFSIYYTLKQKAP